MKKPDEIKPKEHTQEWYLTLKDAIRDQVSPCHYTWAERFPIVIVDASGLYERIGSVIACNFSGATLTPVWCNNVMKIWTNKRLWPSSLSLQQAYKLINQKPPGIWLGDDASHHLQQINNTWANLRDLETYTPEGDLEPKGKRLAEGRDTFHNLDDIWLGGKRHRPIPLERNRTEPQLWDEVPF